MRVCLVQQHISVTLRAQAIIITTRVKQDTFAELVKQIQLLVLEEPTTLEPTPSLRMNVLHVPYLHIAHLGLHHTYPVRQALTVLSLIPHHQLYVHQVPTVMLEV